jgi:hypothetical protein
MEPGSSLVLAHAGWISPYTVETNSMVLISFRIALEISVTGLAEIRLIWMRITILTHLRPCESALWPGD